MIVLIINGYNDTYSGRKSFEEFLSNIQKIIKEESEKHGCFIELIICKRNQLREYLYDIPTSYNQIECGKTFDNIDLIYIAGEINLLPWMPEAEQMLILIKMCLKVHKPLFASGFGMHAIAFLTASNIDRPIQVINGNGKGTKTSELQNLEFDFENLKTYDHFLDHITGDLYQYNPEHKALIPISNTGLHLHSAANGFNALGKYIIKTKVYTPNKAYLEAKNDVVMEGAEALCSIKKHLLSHWLFEECETSFVTPTKAKWEIHPFIFMNKNNVFHVLAESNKGPLIIEMKNMIGVKFDIDHKYRNTIQILRNYTKNILEAFSNNQLGQMISIITINSNSHSKNKDLLITQTKSFSSINKKKMIKSLNNSPLSSTKARKLYNELDEEYDYILNNQKIHGKSGYNNNNNNHHHGHPNHGHNHHHHHSPIEEKNTIGLNMIKILPIPSSSSLSSSVHKPKPPQKANKALNILENQSPNTSTMMHYKQNEYITSMGMGTGIISPKDYHTPKRKLSLNPENKVYLSGFLGSNAEKRNMNRMENMNIPDNICNNSIELLPNLPQNKFQLSMKTELKKSNIRKLLYPELEPELTETKDVWVPGNYSINKKNKHPIHSGASTPKKTINFFNETKSPKYSKNQYKFKDLIIIDPGVYTTTNIAIPYDIEVNPYSKSKLDDYQIYYDKGYKHKSYAIIHSLASPNNEFHNQYSNSKLLFSPISINNSDIGRK